MPPAEEPAEGNRQKRTSDDVRPVSAPSAENPPVEQRRVPWPDVVRGLLGEIPSILPAAVGAALTALATREPVQVLAAFGILCFVLIALYAMSRRKPGKRHLAKRVLDGFMLVSTGIAWALAGVAIVGLVLLAGWIKTNVLTGSCREPLQIRVVTAPENVTALEAATSEYATQRTENACQTADFTVIAESSISTLQRGFANGWQHFTTNSDVAMLGPQPDIWIPDSYREVAYVRPQTNSQDVTLDDRGSIGTSPLVLAVFSSDYESLSGGYYSAHPQRLASLIGPRGKIGAYETLVRATPDTSEAAMIGTPALYAARAPLSPATVERGLRESGLAFPDAAALLCHFRAEIGSPTTPPPHVALVVPEQALDDYDYGRPLGAQCAGRTMDTSTRKWQLFPYYAKGLPTLDYRFVHVHWAGQDTARRSDMIEDFRQWLKVHPLAAQGYRATNGMDLTPEQIGSTDQPYLRTLRNLGENDENVVPRWIAVSKVGGDLGATIRHVDGARPALSIDLLLDISGSMGAPAAQGSRLSRAITLAQDLSDLTESGDTVGLTLFSNRTNPDAKNPRYRYGYVAPSRATTRQQNRVNAALQAENPHGADLPLTKATREDARRFSEGARAIVLLTDGQVPGTNRGFQQQASALAAALKRVNPKIRVHVVLTGPARCSDDPVRTIVAPLAAAHIGDCTQMTSDASDTATRQLATQLLGTILNG